MPEKIIQIQIRNFQPEDFADFLEIEQQSYRKEIAFDKQKLYSFLGDADIVAFCVEATLQPPETEELAATNTAEPVPKAVQKKLIGTLLLKIQKFKNQIWLVSIAISPEYRRQGFGQQALKYATELSLFLRSNELLLQVEENNHSAVQLFQKHDFLTTEKLTDFLLPNNLGLSMKKNLV